jgi:hypothetical protein
MGARAPFSSFTLPQTASEERRQLSEQAVISRTEPYNLDWSTLADSQGTSSVLYGDEFKSQLCGLSAEPKLRTS